MEQDNRTRVDVEGLDEATVAQLRSLSGDRSDEFGALSPRERRVWLRLKYEAVGDDRGEPRAGLTRDDIRRLGMLPATPPDEKDAYWRDLHGKLHATRA